jgi:PAS domain S-box-containing protein
MRKPLESSSDGPNFKKLFESAPGLYLVLTPTFRIVAVSNAYLKATMTSRDNIVGKHLFEVFPDNPEDSNASGMRNLTLSLNRVIQNRATDVMTIQKYDIQRPVSEGGGFEERFWKPVNSPVIDAYGNLEYIIHQVEDVTDITKLEIHKNQNEKLAEALAISKTAAETNLQHFFESELKYKHLIEIAPDAVISLDANGVIINWNIQAIKMFGWTKTDVIGKRLFDIIIPPRIRSSVENNIIGLANLNDTPNETKPFEIFALRKDGEEKEVEVKMSTSTLGNHLIFIVFIRDITERKQLQHALENNIVKLKAANEELESFSYSISHNLRTPLRAIHGYTRIITSELGHDFSKEARGLMEAVMQNAKRMGQLIDDLLTFTKIGKKDLQYGEINMNAVVDSILTDIKNTKPLTKAAIQVSALPNANGDYNLITQVFVHLVSNALKFSTGRVNPVIEIGAILKTNEVVYFVKDNGVGFDMQYYEKLFGVFQRLHSIKDYEGTGVGLALVKRIITRHGGKIWAESKLDHGSTFYFSLNK